MNKKILTAAIGAAMIVGPLAAQADLKVSGRVAGELTSNSGPGIVFGDSGHTRLQFDIKNEGSYARLAFDARGVFSGYSGKPTTAGGSPVGARDGYLGLKGGWGSVQAGRMAGAVKNLEKDPFIATFLEMRNNAVSGGSYGSSSFVNTMLQYANKMGDISFKVQYDATDSGGKNGDLGLGVKAKLAGADVFLGYNNEGNGGDTFTKLGGSMKFGDIKGKLYYQNDSTGAGETRFAVGAEIKMAGGMIDVTYGDKGQTSTSAYYRVGYMKKMNKKTRWFVGYVQNGAKKSGSTGDTATYGGGVRVDI